MSSYANAEFGVFSRVPVDVRAWNLWANVPVRVLCYARLGHLPASTLPTIYELLTGSSGSRGVRAWLMAPPLFASALSSTDHTSALAPAPRLESPTLHHLVLPLTSTLSYCFLVPDGSRSCGCGRQKRQNGRKGPDNEER